METLQILHPNAIHTILLNRATLQGIIRRQLLLRYDAFQLSALRMIGFGAACPIRLWVLPLPVEGNPCSRLEAPSRIHTAGQSIMKSAKPTNYSPTLAKLIWYGVASAHTRGKSQEAVSERTSSSCECSVLQSASKRSSG